MADAKPAPNHPEKKIGPFNAGIGVAVWLNVADTDNGPKKYRSITISPRRYLDRETGEWQDSGCYYVGDLPALIFALTKAQEYAFETPIPGQTPPATTESSGEVPY